MLTEGTMTVMEFINFAKSRGATLHTVDGIMTNELGEEFHWRYLKMGERTVPIHGENDNLLLLHGEVIEFLRARLGMAP